MNDSITDPLKFASLVAHQLKGPVISVDTILQTLLGEFAGPVTAKQKDLLTKAISRCDESIVSAARLLAISRAINDPAVFRGVVELASIVRKAAICYNEQAVAHNIGLTVKVDAEPAQAVGNKAAIAEVVDALLSNAIKYTPDNGQIEVLLLHEKALGSYQIRVADSGVGIPKANIDRLFEPFYRTPGAHKSSRPGSGLGLAFVKAMVDAAGGQVTVEKSHLGGTEFIVNLNVASVSESEQEENDKKTNPVKVLIIGGVAAGPKVAAKINRLNPDADVTIVEKGMLLSYAGCGLPYYIGGVVADQTELMSSPAGVVRDPIFFQQVKNVHIMNQTEAIRIDRDKKQVLVKHILDGSEALLDYDKLVLATGSVPIVPNIKGVDLGNIFTLHGVCDAEGIKAVLDRQKARDVAIVGGGLIGIEMTEALAKRGCRVTIIEKLPQILRIVDKEIAMLIENHLESQAVRVLTDAEVKKFKGSGNRVEAVVTENGTYPADLVIIAVGNRPNVELAKQAGLQIGTTGALKVSSQMQTSDENIYAAGDCVECVNLITNKPYYVPLGSTANKQGRIAAINICGGDDKFSPILGTVACKVFDYNVAVTGLTTEGAIDSGYEVETVLVPAPDREHFVPGAGLLITKLIVDKKSRRLLGAQTTGPGCGDKRIDVAATAITAGMTLEQIANLDLCYAPPFAPVIDNIITAANVARNKLDGLMESLSLLDVKKMLDEKQDFIMLDVRTPAEYQKQRLNGAVFIPLASLRSRFYELDKEKPIVAFCNYSLRAYEAAIILKRQGFKDVKVLEGGLATWPFE